MHLLDDALRLSIFERLSARDLASVSGVSREWRRLGRDEHLWRALVAASPPALVPRCETSSSRHLFVLNEAWRLGRFRRLGRWRAPATRVFDLAFRPPPPRPRATTTGDDEERAAHVDNPQNKYEGRVNIPIRNEINLLLPYL